MGSAELSCARGALQVNTQAAALVVSFLLATAWRTPLVFQIGAGAVLSHGGAATLRNSGSARALGEHMAAPVQYDPNVIQGFAEALYQRASSLVVSYALLGAVGGAAIGFIGGMQVEGGMAVMAALVGGAVGAFIGYSLAAPRAFMLRLQAQQALCQMQIEANTRSVALALETQQRAAA